MALPVMMGCFVLKVMNARMGSAEEAVIPVLMMANTVTVWSIARRLREIFSATLREIPVCRPFPVMRPLMNARAVMSPLP